ncbi:hypothetical protein LIER_33466 [Lithospermum erythrorhizon]|uniref:Uncharacterized protein n=1 Tax=Lithospermum erythrorhizon TaxID=34254 RepID=A0AAV3RWT7_LITER
MQKPNDTYIGKEEDISLFREIYGTKQPYFLDYEEDQPIWTFRVFILGSVSCIILLILNKFILKQTAECITSMISNAIVAFVLGHIMARYVPKRMIFWRKLRLEFCINPGGFNIKELALISIFGNVGAVFGGLTSCLILNPLKM